MVLKQVAKSRKYHVQEGDLQNIVHDSREMVNRWRGRLRISADNLARATDPVERRKMEYMFYCQKKKLAEWEKKAKK